MQALIAGGLVSVDAGSTGAGSKCGEKPGGGNGSGCGGSVAKTADFPSHKEEEALSSCAKLFRKAESIAGSMPLLRLKG